MAQIIFNISGGFGISISQESSRRVFNYLQYIRRKKDTCSFFYTNIYLEPHKEIFLTFSYWDNNTFFLIIFCTKPPQKNPNFSFLPFRIKWYQMQGNISACGSKSIVARLKPEVLNSARSVITYNGWPFAISIRESKISLASKIWPAKHIFMAYRLHKQTVPLKMDITNLKLI